MVRKRAYFRFHSELGDLLPTSECGRWIERSFDVSPTVKDMIEGLGVPHTEVGLIELAGEPLDLSYRIRDGDRLDVHPNSAGRSYLRPELPAKLRFVADANLGRLARYLRLLGFDTIYRNDLADEEVTEIAAAEDRVVLSRDAGVLKRRAVIHGYFVRADEPRVQLLEVVRRFALAPALRPFTRCPNCNCELVNVPKSVVADLVPPGTAAHARDFRRCEGCGQVYWEGAHHERIRELIRELIAEVEASRRSSIRRNE